jgi:hypothetical protein
MQGFGERIEFKSALSKNRPQIHEGGPNATENQLNEPKVLLSQAQMRPIH